jgi:imidazolonepropionase-like amidohydrolase
VGNDFNDRFMKERLPLTEMKALLDAGMTYLEVIEAATRHAAIVSGANDLGTLEPGKLADLIIVDGNPLENIDALTRIRLVILDGEVAYGSK